MPPKRKPAPKKKQESPPPSPPSESEPESEPEEYSSEEEPESPKPKKTKAALKPKTPPKRKAAPAPTPSPKKLKAAPAQKKQAAKKGGKTEVVAEKAAPVLSPEKKSASKHVVIEHCKQCQSFKRTAVKLEQLLKKSIPDLEVSINPDKPRKGIFEVRDDEGNVFLSLQGLVRPFKKMKDLNLEETAEDVASKIT